MTQKISIDPFTRIEGHLAISLDVEDNRVAAAQCSGEMFRGFEQILKGRSPADSQQIAQRICGVCPVSQGMAAVLAQEDAYKLEVPQNGRIIRNIMLGGNYIHNHITHFYHLSALDFLDIKGVLAYSGSDRFLLGIRDWVRSELQSRQIFPAAPFLPRFEGTYMQEQERNISILKHYFDALEMRAIAHQLVAIFSGKMPHMATLVPGGVTEKVSTKKIALCRSKLQKLREFIEHVYANDIMAVAAEFPEYWTLGKGCGNFLSYGVFPDPVNGAGHLFPAGVLVDGQLSPVDTGLITEQVKFSKYSADSGFHKTQPEPHKDGAYSWIKAPRYNGRPLEVGPLARIMIGYHDPGYTRVREITDNFLRRTGRSLSDLDSCLGRHVVRLLELQLMFEQFDEWIEQLDPLKPTAADFQIPAVAEGKGMTEAPRGALGHWLTIKDGKIDTYECIVPTTWNCSPKDDKDVPGPVEQSLIGTYVADAGNPLEAARVVRSYDPCLACAVH